MTSMLTSYGSYRKILDEYRYTTSGLVAGKVPTGDEGIEKPDERPDNFPASINGMYLSHGLASTCPVAY